jgi:phosphoribosyl 1,2-cyclic phosphodiesterase
VDAGLSRKETFDRLTAIGEDPEQIDGIVITHEHSDHICGLVSLARKLGCPLYVSRLTAPTIPWGDLEPKIEHFQAGARISVGDIEIDSFTIPHDAIDPVGFTFCADGVKVGIVTDLGYMTDSIRVHLRGVNVLLLEANHDLEMLKVGPYPWSVKQRVMGRMGHLSNQVACDFIRKDLDASVHTLILGHLSENNNHPEIVRSMATRALHGRALFTQLIVAEPRSQTEVLDY